MRIISVFIILLFIIACNNSAKKKEDIKDTAKTVTQMPAMPDTIFTGFGTEPFWGVYVINNSKIVFHPADGPDVEVPFVTALMADDLTSKYTSGNDSATLELIITKKNCSDGMSEETYPYTVALSVNKTKYTGCGRAGR